MIESKKDLAIRIVVIVAVQLLISYIMKLDDRPDFYNLIPGEVLGQLLSKNDVSNVPLFPEDQFLSDVSCEFGQFQPENNTILIALSFKPSISYQQYKKATLNCNGVDIPLSFKENCFTLNYKVNIFELQTISYITFLNDDVKETKFFLWKIDPQNYIFPQFFSIARINANGKSFGRLHYNGTLQVFVGHFSEKFGGIAEVNLIKKLNGNVISSKSIKGKFRSETHALFFINTNVRGKIPDGSTLELVVELVDGYGFHYQCILQRLDSNANGLWEDINTTNVYDKDGTFLFQMG